MSLIYAPILKNQIATRQYQIACMPGMSARAPWQESKVRASAGRSVRVLELGTKAPEQKTIPMDSDELDEFEDEASHEWEEFPERNDEPIAVARIEADRSLGGVPLRL